MAALAGWTSVLVAIAVGFVVLLLAAEGRVGAAASLIGQGLPLAVQPLGFLRRSAQGRGGCERRPLPLPLPVTRARRS